MKILLLISLLFSLSFSMNYNTIQGEWRVESYKLNGFVSFANTIGKQRNSTLTLLFSKSGKLKVLETNNVYDYEIINKGNQLKIYKLKTYRDNYIKRLNHKYSILSFTKEKNYYKVKTIKNKISGYTPSYNLKFTKMNNIPTPVITTQHNYNF